MARPLLEADEIRLTGLDGGQGPTPEEENDNEEALSSQSFRNIRRSLYISHFLSTWNSRAFEFGAFLFLAMIYPNTLLPASIYALSRAGVAAALAPWMGRLVDRAGRLFVIRISIVGQRVPVAVSCAVLLFEQSWKTSHGSDTVHMVIVLTILCLLAAVEKLSAMLNTIAVERDWVVVIAGNDNARLRDLNSQMRRIDLSCKLIAPLAISLVAAVSTQAGIWTVASMTFASVFIEYIAIARVYKSDARLQTTSSIAPESEDTPSSLYGNVLNMVRGVTRYFGHRAFLPSFALAVLYMTVFSFSGQLITYLISSGYMPWTIGLLRGAAAIFELSSTWVAPKLMQSIGPIRSGIWFLNLELVCVCIATALLWFDEKQAFAIHGMVMAVIVSRIGLFGFDLCAQIIVQEEVEENLRGSFSSQEFAFQNVFEMLAFATTVWFSDPAQFKFPALFSAAAVALAAVLYALFVRLRRGHLIHLSRCIEGDRKHYDRIEQPDAEHPAERDPLSA